MPRLVALFVVFLVVTAWSADSSAVDRPISATKLLLKRSPSGKERLVFVSNDPAYLSPTLGDGNDPSTGTPGGARIELFSSGPTSVAFDMPAGSGTPGWTSTGGAVVSFKFVNADAPDAFSSIKRMIVKQARSVKVSGKGAGLPLAGSQGAVGVRITMGTLRNCTIFGPSTIIKDVPGKFLAKQATADGVGDCRAETLGGAVCGNGVREPDEICDGSDDAACPGACQSSCTCAPPVCGDNLVNQPSEQCDGTAGGSCPDQPCQPNCQCPVCGDGVVDQPSEQCDGADDAACPGDCQPNCVCLGVCGDGIINQPSEQCDGTGVGGVCGPPSPGLGIGCRPPGSPGECTCCSDEGYFCGDFGCCSPNDSCIIGPHHSGNCCVSFGGQCATTADCCQALTCSAGTCGF
jgi:hypothetical protein